MTEIEIKAGARPDELAELIDSTLHGQTTPGSSAATLGKLVRRHQEMVEEARPSRHDLETLNFDKLDDETDWSNV